MTDLANYINSYFGVTDENLSAIISYFKPESLTKSSFYLKSGKPCNKLSFIRNGIIRIYACTEEKEVTQWVSSKDYFITDLSGLIFNTPSRFNMQALTDCELYTIQKNDYNNLGKIIPEWHHLEKLFIARCFITL